MLTSSTRCLDCPKDLMTLDADLWTLIHAFDTEYKLMWLSLKTYLLLLVILTETLIVFFSYSIWNYTLQKTSSKTINSMVTITPKALAQWRHSQSLSTHLFRTRQTEILVGKGYYCFVPTTKCAMAVGHPYD